MPVCQFQHYRISGFLPLRCNGFIIVKKGDIVNTCFEKNIYTRCDETKAMGNSSFMQEGDLLVRQMHAAYKERLACGRKMKYDID